MKARIFAIAAIVLGIPTTSFAADISMTALSGTWHWVDTVTPGETFKSSDPELYQLQFDDSGKRASIRADCNRGQGKVTAGNDGAINLGPFALTRAMCPPGSLSDMFAGDVGRAVHYSTKDGDLYLELPTNSGVMHFER
jgi:heat shock protein HslJ